MNIFYTDRDIKRCARDHCDQHMIKMATEYAQMMSTAARMQCGEERKVYVRFDGRYGKRVALRERNLLALSGDRIVTRLGTDILVGRELYLPTHPNHPCNVWLRKSRRHFGFLGKLALLLCAEYEGPYQSGKPHGAKDCIIKCLSYAHKFPDNGWEDPPMAMPDEYRRDDVVEAYRAFYLGSKSRFARWTRNRKPPKWGKEEAHVSG